MSDNCGISADKLHDFYHNTWSKQFYDDINIYKGNIRAMVAHFYNLTNNKATII